MILELDGHKNHDPVPGHRLKILHLITELNVGGAERMLEKLIFRMDQQKFQNIVVSLTDKGEIGGNMAERGIPVFELGMKRGRPSVRGLMRLFRLLRMESPDFLQSWLYHADLLGIMVGKMAGIKRIVWGIRCSDMNFCNYGKLSALTLKANVLLSPFPDAIIANSEKGKEIHIDLGFRSKSFYFIPNGFDTEKFRPYPEARPWLLELLNLSDDVLLIGIIARWDPMKDHKNFLDAAAILARENLSAHFLMVGKGVDAENSRIIEWSKNENLKGRVHALGLRRDVAKITAGLDVASSSSAYGEGCPNTVGEAMACGVPCVVTDVGDAARMVGNTGLVVPPGDPKSLSEGWKKVIDLGLEGRRDLGLSARRRIVDNFELSHIARKFENLYRSLK